jgi:hypothetical protein
MYSAAANRIGKIRTRILLWHPPRFLGDLHDFLGDLDDLC